MNNKLLLTFCLIDDFCKDFLPFWNKHLLENSIKIRIRKGKLSISEIMTIYVFFHQSGFRTFKEYYQFLQTYCLDCFPQLVSYSRFLRLINTVLTPLYTLLHFLKGEETGVYFIDSTILEVCHIKRANNNKIFKNLTQKSKSTMGWFYGFKLHLIINDKGEIMAFKITTGNTNDRVPVINLVKGLSGKLIGDKGYLSQKLFEDLYNQGIKMITRVRKNMKNKLIDTYEKYLLRKRAIIESVNDQLKNISQIQHTRYRSAWSFFANVLGALTAYCLQEKKPSIRKNHKRFNLG